MSHTVSSEEQQAVIDEVESLNKEGSLDNATRVRQLGLVLMNVVGEEVLRVSYGAGCARFGDQRIDVQPFALFGGHP